MDIPGIIYVDQHNRWNYCGPANLAMALKFWGWKGSRDDIAKVIKPGINDPKLSLIERGRAAWGRLAPVLSVTPRAGAAHATIYPYGPFVAGDGKSVMLGLQNEREWVAFCRGVLGRDDLAAQYATRLQMEKGALARNEAQLATVLAKLETIQKESQAKPSDPKKPGATTAPAASSSSVSEV